MGVVQKIALTKDLKGVEVTVRMNREAEPLLTDKAQFWVVRPRFFAGAISGFQTLFSGSYIDLLPSSEGGEPQRDSSAWRIPRCCNRTFRAARSCCRPSVSDR